MLSRLGYAKHCPIITVAGTNGKGSSCHLLADYWRRRGKKVGLFTSPHLMRFNERIQINQQMAGDAEIAAAFQDIKNVQGDLELGYFHQVFLAAMLIFQDAQVDLLVLEVGIGGRLDAVNSVDADYVLITSIALDHTEILGEDREAIGFEKAGILRAGQIAVCGDPDAPFSVLNTAAKLGLNIWLAGRDFSLEDLAGYPRGFIPRQNALAVWALLQSMDSEFDAGIFAQALGALHVPGRMQVLALNPQILIDVAHNPHAANYLADYLKSHPVSGQTYAIFSALQDKDLVQICRPLLSEVAHWFLIPLEHERAAGIQALQAALPKNYSSCFESMPVLYQGVMNKLMPEDRVVVFGSFMLVSLFLECHNQSIKISNC